MSESNDKINPDGGGGESCMGCALPSDTDSRACCLGCWRFLSWKLSGRVRLIIVLLLVSLIYFLHVQMMEPLKPIQRDIDVTLDMMNKCDELEDKIIEMDTDKLIETYSYWKYSYTGDVHFANLPPLSFHSNYVKPLMDDLEFALSDRSASMIIKMMSGEEITELLDGAELNLARLGLEFDNQRPPVAAALRAHLSNVVRAKLQTKKSTTGAGK